MRKVMLREVRIWINDDGTFEWKGHNLYPSEIVTMGALLQEGGLKMIGDCEVRSK